MASTDTGFRKVVWHEDFLHTGDETNDIVVGATGAGTQAFNAQVNGAYRLTTSAVDDENVAVGGALIWKANSGGPLIFEARVASVTAITLRAYYVGLTDTLVSSIEMPFELATTTLTSTATDAVGFVYDTDATNDNWHCVGVKADVDGTFVNSGIAPATAGTFQTLRVVVDSDGNAEFFIDSKWVASMTNAVTATVALCAALVDEAREAGAKVIDIDYFHVESGRV